MSNLLKGGGFLFIGRAYNDIDHMTPIAYRLKSDQPNIQIEFLIIDLFKDYKEDFRIKYLKSIGVKVTHILTFFTSSNKLLKSYFGMIKALNDLSRYNPIRIFLNKTIVRITVKYFGSKLNNMSGEAFFTNYFYEKPQVIIIDYSYLEFYYKIYLYSNKNGIVTVAIPHGHNILMNELIMNKSMKINYGKSDEHIDDPVLALKKKKKFKMPYNYIIFENHIIPKRYVDLGIVDEDKVVVLGSTRFSDEWVKKLRDIIPPIDFKGLDSGKLKIVVMLSKPSQNGHPGELERSLRFMSLFPNTYLVIKPHTRNKKYSFENSNKVYVDNLNQLPSPSLIDWADIVFFEHSCICFDSLKRDKPTFYFKSTHANRLMSEKYFNSWEVHCRDDIRDIMWGALNGKGNHGYSHNDIKPFIRETIQPKGEDVLSLYSKFLFNLLS